MIGIKVDPSKADAFYVEYMLQYYKELVKAQGEGTARHNINIGTFKNLSFPMPPVEEQQFIRNALDEISRESRRLKAIYRQKLNSLAELKQSLLQKAFSGELTAESGDEAQEAAA